MSMLYSKLELRFMKYGLNLRDFILSYSYSSGTPLYLVSVSERGRKFVTVY